MSAAVWGIDIRDNGYVHWRSGASTALLKLGDRERAASMAESELADVSAVGSRRAQGIALRALALASGASQVTPLLEQSVAVLRSTPAVLELAHSLAALGGALRREGQRSAARKPLREALGLARSCGAVRLLHTLDDELTAAGVPMTTTRYGPQALTPSELRIARLAAEGVSNRQIAQDLYLTVKTIEMHLSSVYRKLDVSARTQLKAALPG
jgi:DNA-binding CsgD family transcriptional regulator